MDTFFLQNTLGVPGNRLDSPRPPRTRPQGVPSLQAPADQAAGSFHVISSFQVFQTSPGQNQNALSGFVSLKPGSSKPNQRVGNPLYLEHTLFATPGPGG